MPRLLYVLLLLLLMLSLPIFAQQTAIDTLHWSATRRLQLADFHSPAQPGLGGSEFYYQIGYEVKPLSIWSPPVIDAFCLMFRNLSWVSETARTERTLAYNQVLFDLVEVHTRQMKAKLIALKPDRQFKQQAKQIEYLTNAELGAEVNRFRAETGGGDDLAVLQRWQKQVVQRLYDTPDLVTTYRPSRLGYGLFIGGSGAVPTGPMAQTISSLPGLAFGVDVALGRTLLFVHPVLYQGHIRTGFAHQNQNWETGMQVRPAILNIGFGRVAYDSPRSRLIPYVGYRLLALNPSDRNDERYKGFSLIDHGPAAGLVFDIKLGNNTPKPDRSEDAYWFIRSKLSYSPVLGSKPFSGGMVSLQIGLGGFGRVRKVTYRPERTVIVLPGNII